MHWIIQDKIFGEETHQLIKHLDDYELVDALPKFIPKNSIVRGSIQFVESYQKKFPDHKRWLTVKNYDCSTYYPALGKKILNSQYLLIPWRSLVTEKSSIFSVLDCERFFIRPNSGRKIFTGTTLSKKWWDKELDIIRSLPNSSIKDGDLVLISTDKHILAEYRVLMYYNRIIGWTRYAGERQSHEDLAISSICNSNEYFPDEYYTLDIAATDNGFKILELNSFVSAGLYDMDYSKLASEFQSFSLIG